MKKRLLSMGLIFTLSASLLFGCGSKEGSAKKTGETLTILNYGKYYDEDALKAFEDETGITIKYEEYESPEEMYTKYKAGSIDYDLICSSEYMVEKLKTSVNCDEFIYLQIGSVVATHIGMGAVGLAFYQLEN